MAQTRGGANRMAGHKGRGMAALKGIVEISSTDDLPLASAARARTDIVSELSRHGYSEKELSELVVPKRTLARRRSENELLTVEETDKALRLKRIATLAEKVFGDPTKAQRWMRKPKRSLAGETPLAYLASENGARVVEEMLRRIEHGIFA
jgi:putative toxin-antitoxin system antitoxin component (TIGR02293 family)